MPFLAPLVPALIGGAASAAGGAAVNAVGNGISNAINAGKQPQQVGLDQPVSAQGAQGAINQAQGGIDQQQALIQQLQNQGGIQNQSNVFSQQQSLANQLGQMAQGNGPSVAIANLNNATGQNVANQAALMAGQRGAGANAGLIARQAAQQGGALQQQAAGQAATLRQQEQLNAIGALQNQQGMLGNLATQQVGQQANALNNFNQLAQGQQGAMLGQINNQNAQRMGQQQGINQINAGQVAQANQGAQQMGQGLASGLGSAVTAGLTSPTAGRARTPQDIGPSRQNGLFAEGGMIQTIGKENYKGRSRIGMHLYASGGKVQDMKTGGHVPGTPKVGGAVDSYANDTVPAKLSPGEIVLPRSVTQSKDPVTAAAQFVAALQAKKGTK